MKGRGAFVESNTAAAKEANRLYWQTERSVAEIADKLTVSRRALYELITPQSSGMTCKSCGGDVVFTNRSAKAGNAGRCAKCGAEYDTTVDDDDDAEETLTPYAAGWPRVVQRHNTDDVRGRAMRLGGAAVAGAALGAIAALLVMRRR
jgi:hypothetical protein